MRPTNANETIGEGNFTLDTNNSFIDVSLGTVLFADLDNDNDIYLAGTYNDLGGKVAKIYENNGGVFAKLAISPFDLVTTGSAKAKDIDGDNYLDIITIGSTNRIANSKYVNEFRTSNVSKGSVAFGKVNDDNYIDLLLSGYTADNKEITSLYINDGYGGFSKVESIVMDGLSRGCIALIDLDNDGDDDVLTSGSGLTKLYRNITKKGITTDIKDSQNQLASHGDITLHPNPTNENIYSFN